MKPFSICKKEESAKIKNPIRHRTFFRIRETKTENNSRTLGIVRSIWTDDRKEKRKRIILSDFIIGIMKQRKEVKKFLFQVVPPTKQSKHRCRFFRTFRVEIQGRKKHRMRLSETVVEFYSPRKQREKSGKHIETFFKPRTGRTGIVTEPIKVRGFPIADPDGLNRISIIQRSDQCFFFDSFGFHPSIRENRKKIVQTRPSGLGLNRIIKREYSELFIFWIIRSADKPECVPGRMPLPTFPIDDQHSNGILFLLFASENFLFLSYKFVERILRPRPGLRRENPGKNQQNYEKYSIAHSWFVIGDELKIPIDRMRIANFRFRFRKFGSSGEIFRPKDMRRPP